MAWFLTDHSRGPVFVLNAACTTVPFGVALSDGMRAHLAAEVARHLDDPDLFFGLVLVAADYPETIGAENEVRTTSIRDGCASPFSRDDECVSAEPVDRVPVRLRSGVRRDQRGLARHSPPQPRPFDASLTG